MGRSTGEVQLMRVGERWTYRLRLEEHTGGGSSPTLVLGRGIFTSEEEARSEGEAHLKQELAQRSG